MRQRWGFWNLNDPFQQDELGQELWEIIYSSIKQRDMNKVNQ